MFACQFVELDEDGEDVLDIMGCRDIPKPYAIRLVTAAGWGAVYADIYLCEFHAKKDSYAPDTLYEMDSDFQWGGF